MRDAIPAHDWETATRACERAMDIPDAVTGGPFAARVIVSPSPSFTFPLTSLAANTDGPLPSRRTTRRTETNTP